MAEGYADANGLRLWFEERGRTDGAPVVLAMGVDASALWWPPELVDALAGAGYRVVRFDSRDIGLSSYLDPATPPYGLPEMAADAVGLLDALGIDSAHYLGMSLGGMIGQHLALRHPERLRSLTLLSTTPGPDERLSPPTDALMDFFAAPPDEDPLEYALDFCRALAGSGTPFDEPYYRALLAADAERGMNPNSRHGLIPESAASRLDDLANVGVPTLVVHGTEDPLFPYDHARALARTIPGASLVPWEGVGHELPPERALELSRLLIRHIGPAG